MRNVDDPQSMLGFLTPQDIARFLAEDLSLLSKMMFKSEKIGREEEEEEEEELQQHNVIVC